MRAGTFSTTIKADSKEVLDPRVAYVMTTMMEAVVNNGTGYPVRARGFQAPAAGKTGTSHDAWFAGYTSNLLCIVWVGNDDYTDLKLAGGATAAPIWAEFMKRAAKLPQYADMKNFPAPSGVVEVTLDKVTNRLATASCPQTYTVAFIAGTEPKETCDQAAGDHRGFLHQDLRPGIAAGCAATADHQWRGPAGTGRNSSPRRRQPARSGAAASTEKEAGLFQPPLRQGRQRSPAAK